MRKAALNAFNLIIEKRNGKVKRRFIVDGRKQHSYCEKADISSPALLQDGFFLCRAVDAMEERYIATTDIAGAFLKAEQTDFALVRLQSPAVDAF